LIHIFPTVPVQHVGPGIGRRSGRRSTSSSRCWARIGSVALRSYLCFLQFCGHPTVSLQGAIPRPPSYALSGLPTSLDEVARARFWAAFDHSTPVGKRDYAMARCLADLGLRCCEVPLLTLDSIDWRKAQLQLAQAKARRAAVLPLPAATAKAILDYLQHGRPATDSRALFVHHRAPFGHAVRKTTVRAAIRQAFKRAGLPWSGTHILRRTLATQLLAHGAPLTEIAEVLRHRSIDTTRIYTKVDQTQLARVAQPWPGSVS
jgi:site-specific recombinase XerD